MKINQRLFDHYGINTHKDLKISERCPRPFDTVLIDKQGSCYACECTSWLPQSLGNLQIKTLTEILNDPMRQHLQGAITDGTYRYCNEHQCHYIKAGKFEGDSATDVRYIRLAIDDSCNLKCPSCRDRLIFHKSGSAFDRGIRLADRINDWLAVYDRPVQVHIGSDGDPFASHIYRHFMEHTPHRNTIRYSVMTNGLMFDEFHHKVPNVMSNLDELAVSIDGATKTTYEALRLGGRWDKILSNLQSIADSKVKNNFTFSLHMVVQQDNWWEMVDMIRIAKRYGADQVYFNNIKDWNTGLDHSGQMFSDLDEFKSMCREINNRSERFENARKYLIKGFDNDILKLS